MRYGWVFIAYLLGGFTGFLMCSLFAIRSINRMEREDKGFICGCDEDCECSVCGHLPYHHGGKNGDECDACLDGRCGGGFIPIKPR